MPAGRERGAFGESGTQVLADYQLLSGNDRRGQAVGGAADAHGRGHRRAVQREPHHGAPGFGRPGTGGIYLQSAGKGQLCRIQEGGNAAQSPDRLQRRDAQPGAGTVHHPCGTEPDAAHGGSGKGAEHRRHPEDLFPNAHPLRGRRPHGCGEGPYALLPFRGH